MKRESTALGTSAYLEMNTSIKMLELAVDPTGKMKYTTGDSVGSNTTTQWQSDLQTNNQVH